MKFRYFVLTILLLALLTSCGAANPVNSPAADPQVTEEEAVEAIAEVEPPKTQSITISAVGDIMVHDNSLASVKTKDGYDFDPPFSETMSIIREADLAIGNLETTISGTDTKYSGYPKFNSPDSLLDTLKKSGYDVLITTNNHCLDRGTAGLIRTIDQLDKQGILHTGTYKTKEDSEKILVVDVKGIKVAILAYTYGTNGQKIEKPYMVNLIKMDKMLADVKKAKELKPDIIIAYMHMGQEIVRQPNQKQKETFEKLIKAGVDIVLGDHPHVVQPMERKTIIDDTGRSKEGFIIYSLGNFISGREGLNRDLGVILNIKIEKDNETGKVTIKETEPIPTWVQFYKKDGKDTYRVMPISRAIEKYESGEDEYISSEEYEYLKDKLPLMLEHINNGPKWQK